MADASPARPSGNEAALATNRDESFAEVPENLWSKVRDAPTFTSEFNEENIFREQYLEAARTYFESAMAVEAQGRAIAKLFLRWQPVVRQFAEFVLSSDADNPLDATLSWDPEGAGEAMLRPIRTDTFANASYTQSPGPSQTGQFNLIPDQSQGNAATETATGNEQAWIIFGWFDPLVGNEVPYDYVQANVNDNIGVRREEFLLYQMEGKQTLKLAERFRGPLMVEPGFTLDIDVNIKTTGIDLSLWPIGIEIIRADATEFGGVLG